MFRVEEKLLSICCAVEYNDLNKRLFKGNFEEG